MKLFSKKHKAMTGRQQALAERIAGRLLRFQRQLADRLNLWTGDISLRGWLAMLIAFCAVSSAYLVWTIIQALN